MPIRYSTGLHASDVRPKPGVCENFRRFSDTLEDLRKAIGITLEDTRAQMYAKKARLPYIWHSMKDVAVGRNALNAGDRDVLFLDMDGCDEEAWRALRDALACFSCFTYSTPSHLHPTVKGELRWRICMELDRSVTPEEYKCLGSAVENWLMDCINLLDDYPVGWDRSVYNPDHMLYGPDENAVFERFSGTPVTVDILLARAGDLPIRPVSDHSGDDLSRLVDLNNVTQQTFDDLRSAMWHPAVLADAQPECGRHNAWASMGCRLAWFIGTEFENQARELWLEWSVAGGGSAADIAEAERRWDEGKLVADRTGYQAIFTRAQKEGWINPGAERMRLSSVASVEDFADVSVAEKGDEVAEYLPWPTFTRDKNDKIEGVISNVLLALRRSDLCGVQIRLDEFRDEIILTTPKGKNIQLRDEYYTKLHTTLESLGFKKFEEAAIKRAVRLIAWENRFDSLKEWVNTLPAWDGVPRIDTFFIRHWGIKESAYTRSVGRYWWTLLAGRALVPGIKGDMAVILVSQQGKNKSEGIRAMAPTPDHYMELDFGKKGEERIREMRGHNVIELGEMRGMDKRGIGDVRVTISTRADRNRGLFREHYVTLPRRCGFIGTSNSDTPLTDTEGNRRWLPMTIPDETDGKFIAQGIADEKIQLWAEAVAIFKREGIAWERAETLAKSILGDYEVKDEVWTTSVAEWLEQETVELTGDDIKLNRERVPLTSKDILIDAIGFKATQVKRGDEMRVAKIMKDLGYKKHRLQNLAGNPYHWEKCK